MSASEVKEIHDKLTQHSYEIDALKSSTGELVDTLKETTKAMNDLATNFALSAQKHDENQKDIDKLNLKVDAGNEKLITKIDAHSEKIALMFPTVEALRGMVWKLVGAMFLGVSGSAAVVATIIKMG